LRQTQQIFFITICLLLLSSAGLHAQLITDSEARLKTVSKKREGFFQQKRQRRRNVAISQKPVFENNAAPRYSSPVSFRTGKLRSSTPRYSKGVQSSGISLFRSNRSRNQFSSGGSPYVARNSEVQPRYSQPTSGVFAFSKPIRYSEGSPFSAKDNRVSPRYSHPNQKGALALAKPPRYSAGSPFRPGDHKVKPRYTQGSKEDVIFLSKAPRYSTGMPFQGKDFKVTTRYGKPVTDGIVTLKRAPRYSTGMPFQGKDFKVTTRYSKPVSAGIITLKRAPRYSTGMPFQGKDFKVDTKYGKPVNSGVVKLKKAPRYSEEVVYPKWIVNVKPRYSPEPPFADQRYNISPRYTINKDYSLKRYWQTRGISYWGTISSFKGPVYIDRDKKRDYHPSAGYINSQKHGLALSRNISRKWSITWNRWNGNNVQPKAVTQRTVKPKYDRKEREIWNN
jgi:hypothetical protein